MARTYAVGMNTGVSRISGCAAANDNVVEIEVTGIDVSSEAVRASMALLSKDERLRAARFALDRDRRRFTVARAQLRRLLAMRLDARPDSIELVYGERGKPALAPPYASSGLRFNVSHADDVTVYALAHKREIGVDVEAIRGISDADEIARFAFSRGERAAYLALGARDKPVGFLNCWTRKEAFVKALGEGLNHRLDRFDVSLAPDEPARILRVADAPGDACGWDLHSFTPGPGLIGALVVQQAADRSGPQRVVVRALPS